MRYQCNDVKAVLDARPLLFRQDLDRARSMRSRQSGVGPDGEGLITATQRLQRTFRLPNVAPPASPVPFLTIALASF